jgi:membrane fusion protein (multidrug efflux system)
MLEHNRCRLPGLLAALLIISLAAACRWSGPAQPPPAAEPAVQAPAAAPGATVRPGTVAKALVLPVTSGYAGRIGELYVSDGQAVKAGQPLYKIAAAPPPPQASGGYDALRKEYERLQKLYEQGAIPRRQVENAAARLQAARPAASGGGEPLTVTAPVDGIVTAITAAAGDAVEAGRQVLALGGGQQLAVVVPLRQNELSSVPLGATVAVEADGQTLKGRIVAVYPETQGDKVTGFQAHIGLVDPPAGLLKEGLPLNVRLDGET